MAKAMIIFEDAEEGFSLSLIGEPEPKSYEDLTPALVQASRAFRVVEMLQDEEIQQMADDMVIMLKKRKDKEM